MGVRRLRFPTGVYVNPFLPQPRLAPEYIRESAGVVKRRLLSAMGTVAGEWTHTSDFDLPEGLPQNDVYQMRTEVVDPNGYRRI